MMHRATQWCWLWLLGCLSVLNAGEPRLIGRSSCGAATCHGGLTDRGEAWHSSDSVWRASDPHLLAGNVLLNPLSRRIVGALEPKAIQSADTFEEILVQRCVSCHAPSVVQAPTAPASAPTNKSAQNSQQVRLRNRLADGVSCEACHGAASEWLTAHTISAWDQKGTGRFAAEFGMKDTETLASRTENCASCHVGSRSRDGLVRDMNHDMIAAGHPALHFDFWQAHYRLPPHWDPSRETLSSVSAEQAPAMYSELRKHVLVSAVRLSEERAVYSKNDLHIDGFDPELSEFDCAACHHTLAINSPRLTRGSSGNAEWLPWYTAGQVSPAVRSGLHIHAKEFLVQRQALREQLAVESRDAGGRARDALARVRELVFAESFGGNANHNGTDGLGRTTHGNADGLGRPFHGGKSYADLPVWLDELEALIPKASNLSPDIRTQLQQAVVAGRERLLPIKSDTPLALQRLMPSPWSVPAAEQTRRQLQEIIVPTASGAQQ